MKFLVRIWIHVLGSLHSPDSLFLNNNFFLCFEHFKISALLLEKILHYWICIYVYIYVYVYVLCIRIHIYLYYIYIYAYIFTLFVYIYMYMYMYIYIYIYIYITFLKWKYFSYSLYQFTILLIFLCSNIILYNFACDVCILTIFVINDPKFLLLHCIRPFHSPVVLCPVIQKLSR